MSSKKFNMSYLWLVVLATICVCLLIQIKIIDDEYTKKIHDLENYVDESITIIDKIDVPSMVARIVIYAGENKVCEYYDAKIKAQSKKVVYKGESLISYTYDIETETEHVVLTYSGDNIVQITPMPNL